MWQTESSQARNVGLFSVRRGVAENGYVNFVPRPEPRREPLIHHPLKISVRAAEVTGDPKRTQVCAFSESLGNILHKIYFVRFHTQIRQIDAHLLPKRGTKDHLLKCSLLPHLPRENKLAWICGSAAQCLQGLAQFPQILNSIELLIDSEQFIHNIGRRNP